MGSWRQFAFSIDARTVTRRAVPHSFQPREVALWNEMGAGKGRPDSWAIGVVLVTIVLVCIIFRRSRDKLFAAFVLLTPVQEGGQCRVSASVTARGGGVHSNLPSFSMVASR